MTGWNVYLNGRKIETVFYQGKTTADYVRRNLINNDGYDEGIVVQQERRRRSKSRISNVM